MLQSTELHPIPVYSFKKIYRVHTSLDSLLHERALVDLHRAPKTQNYATRCLKTTLHVVSKLRYMLSQNLQRPGDTFRSETYLPCGLRKAFFKIYFCVGITTRSIPLPVLKNLSSRHILPAGKRIDGKVKRRFSFETSPTPSGRDVTPTRRLGLSADPGRNCVVRSKRPAGGQEIIGFYHISRFLACHHTYH